VLNLEEFGMKPPVNVGDIRQVKIEAVGSEGDGIAKIDGFVVFVPGAKLNDDVTVRITKVLRKYGFAELVE
jgi:predicted RNA-binding protein with TRAM domain